MKKLIVSMLVVSQLLVGVAYAEPPANVVYNNGPVGGSGEGVCMERLRATEKELDAQSRERNIAVTETNYRIARDNDRWSPVAYFVIGILAGGAGTYFITRKK